MTKKRSLKEILKPLIKKYVKEVLLEEGFLSNIIKETITGYRMSLQENKEVEKYTEPVIKEEGLKYKQQTSQKLNEARQKLNKMFDRNGYGGVNVFDNVTPAPKTSKTNQYSPLRDLDPSDPGVDLGYFSNFINPSVMNKLTKGGK